MKITINFFFLLLNLFTVFNLIGQDAKLSGSKSLGNIEIKNYSNKFLERPESVWSVIRSNKSKKVYFGTYGGILEYDGKNVNTISVDGEIENEIATSFTRTLVEDSQNNLYAAGRGFFGKIVNGPYGNSEYLSLMEKIPDSINPYTQVFWGGVNKENSIYLYSRDLVLRYDGKSFDRVWKLSERKEGVDSYGTIQTLIKVDDRIFVRVWGIGLFELKNDEFKFIENSEIYSNNRIESMVSLSQDKIAIFSSTLGVIIYNESQFIPSKNRALNNWVKEKLIYNTSETKKLSDGRIPLISFEGGIMIIDDKLKIIDLIDLNDGLSSNSITSIHVDTNDDLYTTSLLSASKIRLSNSITSFGESNGIKGLVQSIKKIKGDIYFSTTEDVFKVESSYSPMFNSNIKDLEFNDIPKNFIQVGDNILSVNNLNTLLLKGKNKILFSSDRQLESPVQSMLAKDIVIMSHPNDGVVFFKISNSGSVRKIRSKKIFGQVGVLGIKEIAKGVLFIEAINGEGSFIGKYNKFGNISFTRLLTPNNDTVFSNEEYPKDQLFNSNISNEDIEILELNILETGIGFLIFDQTLDLYQFSEEYKLKDTGQNLLPIFEKNLLNFDPISRFANITGRQNFTTVNQKTKNNWFLTSGGLLEVKFKLDGGFEIKAEYPFGIIDPNELSGAILADSQGEESILWLGSKDSKVISYLPDQYSKENKIDVLPIIDEITLNDEYTLLNEDDYSYKKSRNLKIKFSFPSFDKVEENLFRYRLIGLNENWSEWNKTMEGVFTNLFEGDYTFEIQALDANFNESDIVTHKFSISPPWYRSYIAYLLYVVIMAISIWLFGKLQAKRSLSKAENERREKDLEEAKQIQESMLPKTFPQIEGLSIAAGLITSTEVGGDYYDFFESNDKDNSIHVICGDATGHGTAAGMMVSIIKSALNGLPVLPVNEILERLNNIVKKINLGRLRMSLNVVKINKNEIEISAAAMPPSYLFNAKSKKCEEIMIEGLPLGGLKDEKFTMLKKSFQKGDVLVMLSDGLPEASDENNEMYDYDRIVDLITKNYTKEPEEIKAEFFNSLNSWLNGGIPDDDVTLVIVKKVA